MHFKQKISGIGKKAGGTAASTFLALGLAYAQGIDMNQKVQSNNPAYTAVMDSVLTLSFSSFSIDTSQIDSVFAKMRRAGYTTIKTSYNNVIEYGTAADAFGGGSYSYASDPFNCKIYRIIKDGEVIGWITDKETKRPLMNEFGQPDPFNSYTDRSLSIFFAKTPKGEELKNLLGF
ncbi:MAG: hypothetical protein ACPL06_04530 [Candidatus Anstonellales archaeon]